MLKCENIANIGDTIRAYDFQPMEGRVDKFVEGVVVEKGFVPATMGGGYSAFVIKVTKDTDGDRIGTGVLVPFETTFDYDGRVVNITERV